MAAEGGVAAEQCRIAELRLAVNAGSVLEDDDQRGLAHFVEHMAFNGTRNFPKQEIASFMQALGMRFGAHVNAHTGFDETVYQLQIPTNNRVVIDRSLLIMEDWAHNVTFDPAEIERSILIGPDQVNNGDAYVEKGITHLIFRSGGPDYDLEPLKKLVAWRDSRTGG